jgi:rsbT co-antagonist protein RsbR
METDLKLLGEAIIKNKDNIAQEVHKERMAQITMTAEEIKQFKVIEPQIMKIRSNFVGLFGEALIDYLDKQKTENKIISWGEETGKYLFNLGASLDEALKDASYYRVHIWRVIKKKIENQRMSISTVFEVISIIDPLLDKAAYHFSLTYINSYQETFEKNKEDILELSAPVVPLTKGLAILPLVGNVNIERANVIMGKTLSSAVKLKLKTIIVDLSGILIVDTVVAEQLFRIIDTLKVVGVQTVITGIRPEIAQLIVSKGIVFNNVEIKANLRQAIQELFINIENNK